MFNNTRVSEAQVMGTMNSYVRGSGSSMPRHGGPFENPFEPIWNSYLTLFWALFGLMPLSTVREGSMQSFTKRVGEILLMVYHIMAIIVLINMLIAMMSSSFQEIEDHSDREWKFARSKLWMGYFDEGSTLPPPFNLIISPKSVCKWLRAIKRLLCGCFVKRQQPGLRTARCTTADGTGAKGRYNISVIRSFTNTHVFAFDNVAGDMPMAGEHRPRTSPEVTVSGMLQCRLASMSFGVKVNFITSHCRGKLVDVMRRLVGRFIHQWKKKLRQDGVNEDDLLEIKQDISSLRYELREDRKTQAVHSGVHMDNLRKDILHTIRRSRLPPHTAAETTSPQCRHRVKSSRSFTPPRLTSSAGSAALLSTDDLDDLKCDIVASLRNEIRQVALEMAGVAATPKMAGETNSAAAMAPPTGSELYQTRLYTEL
ncbi:Transient-receptor-potential-like protein [Lamellibrachia satsuma]|nr:Transient-receptor-potential-like protein [Lamellibrachia satsuma]